MRRRDLLLSVVGISVTGGCADVFGGNHSGLQYQTPECRGTLTERQMPEGESNELLVINNGDAHGIRVEIIHEGELVSEEFLKMCGGTRSIIFTADPDTQYTLLVSVDSSANQYEFTWEPPNGRIGVIAVYSLDNVQFSSTYSE